MNPSLDQQIRSRANCLFEKRRREVFERTDHLFGALLLFEWVAVIGLTLVVSPWTWIGSTSQLHQHLVAAVLLGGVVVALPCWLIRQRPGQAGTRYTVAGAQMLMSALLIHATGGRIETHFHIFGSLAFLAFYRDWKVFLPATIVVALDHGLRGTFYPLSVFGVIEDSSWRWLEHAAWVLFCDAFLISSVRQSEAEMGELALQQARLEQTNQLVEAQVIQRTVELSFEKERFHTAFKNAPIGLALLDEKGKILSSNRELSHILGHSESELLALNLFEQMDSPDCASSESREVRIRRQDGEWAWVDFKTSRCQAFCIAQMVDLTERKRAEEALRKSQKLESVGLLAGGIAHEINTPIQFIGDNLRFLKDSFEELLPVLAGQTHSTPDSEYLCEEIPEAIHHSLEGVERVATIVRSIKEYSHSGGGVMVSTDINHLLDSALTIVRSELKNWARVEKDFQPDLPVVACDRSEIGQVFLNILTNAAHAIQAKLQDRCEQGLVRVETRALPEGVSIAIRDTGTGMPEEVRQRIFEPFFTTKEVGKGTGQGLALAQASIHRHRGQLRVETVVGKGTEFIILLPYNLVMEECA